MIFLDARYGRRCRVVSVSGVGLDCRGKPDLSRSLGSDRPYHVTGYEYRNHVLRRSRIVR